jgi:hypothetical protein
MSPTKSVTAFVGIIKWLRWKKWIFQNI